MRNTQGRLAKWNSYFRSNAGIHFLSGVTWIGLLYYFNFVQVPAIAEANADKNGPGPAAINKYVAPRALLWFRWASVVTWLSGALYLMDPGSPWSFADAFTLQGASQVIGVGAWLGTIMLFNVWVLILAQSEEGSRHRRGIGRRKEPGPSSGAARVPLQYDALDPHASLHGGGVPQAAVLVVPAGGPAAVSVPRLDSGRERGRSGR